MIAPRIAFEACPFVERASRATENQPAPSPRLFPNPIHALRGITGKLFRPPASVGARAGTAVFISTG
jgi:hypothetical protein